MESNSRMRGTTDNTDRCTLSPLKSNLLNPLLRRYLSPLCRAAGHVPNVGIEFFSSSSMFHHTIQATTLP